MPAQPAYITRNRHGTFYFRIVVPLPLRSALGFQREIRRTLKTDSQRLALRRARQFAARYEAVFDKVLTMVGAQVGTCRGIPATLQQPARPYRGNQQSTVVGWVLHQGARNICRHPQGGPGKAYCSGLRQRIGERRRQNTLRARRRAFQLREPTGAVVSCLHIPSGFLLCWLSLCSQLPNPSHLI